jgi:hypothetical protein
MASNNHETSGFSSPEFWRNTGFAAVAAAVAVAVENNPPFIGWLVVAALICFGVAGLHPRLKRWLAVHPWLFGIPVAVFSLLFVAGGVYFAVSGKIADPVDNVDEVARGHALAAQQQVASLNASVSGLSGQLAAAMKFQEQDKVTRETAQKAAAAQSERRQKERDAVSGFLDEGNKIRAIADSVTPYPPDLPAKTQQWFKTTLEGLRKIDPSYAAMFNSATGNFYSRTIDGKSIPQANENLWNNVTHKTDALARILEMMPR